MKNITPPENRINRGAFMKKQFAKLCVASGLAILSSLSIAQSALASPTLQRIKSTNTIKLGYMENVYPFSYIDKSTGKHHGFALEISQHIVEALKKELNLPDLKIEYVFTDTKNRWELHKTGGSDLFCATTTNTEERQQKHAAFSYAYFVGHARMLVPVDSGIKDYKALAGKTIGVPRNSGSLDLVLSKKNLFKFKSAKLGSFVELFEELKNGTIDALIYDETSLISILFRNPDQQGKFEIVGKPLSVEHFGCTMQREDPEFKKLVNRALADLMQNKKIHELYDRWFMQPIPPLGNTVGFPMSENTKKILALPNDKAVGQLN